MPERAAPATVAAAARVDRASAAPGTASRRRSPWFAWVHLYEPHFPYAPPEPYASRYRAAPVSRRGRRRPTPRWRRSSQPILEQGGRRPHARRRSPRDHGESLGEHGEHDARTVRLRGDAARAADPLPAAALQAARRRRAGAARRHPADRPRRGRRAASAAGLDGRSLLPPPAAPAARRRPSYFESLSASLNRGWAPLYGVARGLAEVHRSADSRAVRRRRRSGRSARTSRPSRPADVRELQRLLATLRADDRGAAPSRESAETRERLRSLGYLSGTAAREGALHRGRRSEAADRRSTAQIDEVVSRYQRGDLRGAIALGERVVEQRPDMALSLSISPSCTTRPATIRARRAAIRRALALNPAADDVAALAGAYLTEAGLRGRSGRSAWRRTRVGAAARRRRAHRVRRRARLDPDAPRRRLARSSARDRSIRRTACRSPTPRPST